MSKINYIAELIDLKNPNLIFTKVAKKNINRKFFFLIFCMIGFYVSYNAVTRKSVLMSIIRKIYRYL